MHQQRGASGALLSVMALTYGPLLAFAQCDSGITYSAQCGTAQCPEGFPVCTAARAAATGTSALQGPDGSEWSVDASDQRLRLERCSAGHVLVRTMADAIKDTCWACPAGFYSLAQPVFNESNALAKSNTTAGALSACQACPQEAICDGGASVMGKTGWWADTSKTAGVVMVRCKPGACGEGACTAGRSGTMCGKCSQGTGDELGRCEACSSFAARNLVGAIALLLILIATWFPALAPPGNNTHGMGERAWSSAWLSFEGNFKIAVVYFQLFDVYQFWVFPQLQYAPLAVGWAQAYLPLDVWSLLFTDRFWDCLLSQTTVGTVWDTRTKLFVWSLAPICFVLLQLLPCLIVMCVSGVASQRFRNSAGAAGTGVLFLIFISYPSIPRALISLGLDCATLANGTAVLAHDPTTVCLANNQGFPFIYGLSATIFWSVGAPLLVISLMIFYGVPTLVADKVRESEVRSVVRHFVADGGTLPLSERPEDAGVLTREQMSAVLLHPYTGLRSPSDQHRRVSHMSEAGMVTELQALALALVSAGITALPPLQWDSSEGALEDVALAVAGFAFRGYDPRRWYFEFQDMAFRFVLGALLPILLKTSAMQYLPAIVAPLVTVIVMVASQPFVNRRQSVLYAFARVSLSLQCAFTLVLLSDGSRPALGIGIFSASCLVLLMPFAFFIHDRITSVGRRYTPSSFHVFHAPAAEVPTRKTPDAAYSVPPMQLQNQTVYPGPAPFEESSWPMAPQGFPLYDASERPGMDPFQGSARLHSFSGQA